MYREGARRLDLVGARRLDHVQGKCCRGGGEPGGSTSWEPEGSTTCEGDAVVGAWVVNA